MVFSTNKAMLLPKNDVSYIESGIHENITLTNVIKNVSTNGSNFLEFTFTNESGANMKHTEFEPSSSAQNYEERVLKQMSRILQILGVFFTKEDLVSGDLNSVTDFYQWVLNKYAVADKTKKMRIKVVYNDKGYTTLPNYSTYTFVESMTITKENSKIRILSLDKMVRPVADKEPAANNPFMIPASTAETGTSGFVGTTTITDGMPF
jgi:hypothetical protein